MAMRPTSPLPRLLPVALVLAGALLGAGCFTFETLIRVRPDGSGVIEETFLLTGPVLTMMAAFSGEEADDLTLFSKDDLHAKAKAMGGGARLLDIETVKRGEARGYVARFAFDDVAALQLEPQPGGQSPPPEGPPAPSPRLTFAFASGPPAVLRLRFPRPDSVALGATPDPAPAPDSTDQAMQRALLQEMLQGGRFRLALRVEGTVLDTDATHHSGDQITLLDVDFDALLADEAGLDRLTTEQPRSFDDVRALLQEIDGLVVEMQPEVVVRFE